MSDKYTGINWRNYPDTSTPVNSENLNIMDQGIIDAHDRLDELEKNGGGDQTVSWNDLDDKPFYDESVTIVDWNGDTTGLEYIEADVFGDGTLYPIMYKVSDSTFTKEEVIGATLVATSGGETIKGTITADIIEEITSNVFRVTDFALIALENETVTIDGVSFTFSKGVWVMSPEVTQAETVLLSKESLKQLDIKFIPDALYTEIDTRIDNYINDALGGEY